MMDKTKANEIQKEVHGALKFIAAKYGLDMIHYGGNFTTSHITLKVKMMVRDFEAAPASETGLKLGYAPMGTRVAHITLGLGNIVDSKRKNYVIKFDNEKVMWKVKFGTNNLQLVK